MFKWFKLAKRVQELEDTCLRLTRIIESHDLEWADMRARCKRLLDRTEKAARRLDSGVDSEESTAPLGGGGAAAGNGSALTPAQAILQQKILSRRRLTS